MSLGAYIHIPFCTHKCDFCDFAAFAGMEHLEDEYCRIVISEIRARLSGSKRKVSTMFYGGGTPGLISSQNLESIHAAFLESVTLTDGAEISLETTPHSITVEKAKRWLALGINRLSIGVESLQDSELSAMGRDHTRAQAMEGIHCAAEAGFANINCDLMYGLPTQSVESWTATLTDLHALAKSLPIKHISAYALNLGANSPLYSRHPVNSPAYPGDDDFSQMYFSLLEAMGEAGFEQYEISNFARPGFLSRHNYSCWQQAEYLAFGVSAHRFLDGVRSSNWRSLKRYMSDCLGDESHEVIDEGTRMTESIMLGFRLREGIDLERFALRYGFRLEEKFAAKIFRLSEEGFLRRSETRLALTPKAVLVSNLVIAEFI